MSKVYRIYVEKKELYRVEAKKLLSDLKKYLRLDNLENIRILVRYDIQNINEDVLEKAKETIFSEPPVDYLYDETFPRNENDYVFTVEYLPGQFDQRADAAVQCVKLLKEDENPTIHAATTYVLTGDLTKEDYDRIIGYCVNPVDSRVAREDKPETLVSEYEEPGDVEVLDGFINLSEKDLNELYKSLNLAMTISDFLHIQKYYVKEDRNPTIAEIRVFDTYWSDHCRHTTFSTELTSIEIEDGYYAKPIKAAYEGYLNDRERLYKDRDDKYISLMDIATLGAKSLKAMGKLDDLEESDEINACSIIVPIEIDGKTEEWLVMFKNETHNHPTEIEPFGGASTCLGGAIRDPLSGRAYVYQAMRITGAADPRTPLDETLEGKLPQRKIVTQAADGYSSYGNQIGVATGLVDEIYHPNYVAKRMELGAVIAAAPRKNVKREKPQAGDKIILIGGRTGRDGIGGATGSSKAHTTESIEKSGAEVQKGNPPIERNIQRLFRKPEVSRLIKKCNDFGAGGVSVAIGELADGLNINLDKVPKKYAGLDGTEIAISESQERMAIVVANEDVDKVLKYSEEENLEATVVAEVTEERRLVLTWKGKEIVNISRDFLDTNGAHQEASAYITLPEDRPRENYNELSKEEIKDMWLSVLSDLNVASQKGLSEMFDSSVGAATVTMPYGGKYQLTPTQTMISKLPILEGESDTVTMMSYGFDPYLSSWSPFHGALYAVITSVAKIVASGGDYSKIRLTFQEFFKRLGNDKRRWGEPLAALLGAYEAQMKLGLPSIGGKDSMSGSFHEIDVPPTLVSFAVNVGDVGHVITPELKKAGNQLVLFKFKRDDYKLPDYDELIKLYKQIFELAKESKIKSAYALGAYGLVEAISKMAFGNKLGVSVDSNVSEDLLFGQLYGYILAELEDEVVDSLNGLGISYEVIGRVTTEHNFTYKDATISMAEALEAWTSSLEDVFPTVSTDNKERVPAYLYDANKEGKQIYVNKNKIAKPTVFIPVFPGTNSEYDTIKAFEKAGADVSSLVFTNLSPNHIKESIDAYAKAISQAQIIAFPGGFSLGDEPDGSGKFIANIFRNSKIMEATNELLGERDGLVLGICNGFQALIKLGLVPFGEIRPQQEDSPTLVRNVIGRHVAKVVNTKVVSNKSPWLSKADLGGVYAMPISHGEGRFIASDEWIKKLADNGQIATQYVDLEGNPTMDEIYNPNGSVYAIEAITSPDGRVLGKMGHSERMVEGIALNIVGERDQKIFEAGVEYFM
ncbi:MAG: phosphoribosylformylglycinamidine synthase [Clostridiales bacterium]|nr:phosphoribosylformylglycinamidine synthase [Clostridiales bacterium]